MSNPQIASSASEAEAAGSAESLAFTEPEYALGSECAEPALQIEGWGQGELFVH